MSIPNPESGPHNPLNPDIQNPDSHRSIIKSTSVISLGTLVSRVLGFIRDIVLATLLGTGIKADAFFLALKIPNLFRDIVGEGASNAALVPVLAEYNQKSDKTEFLQFINVVLAVSLIILSLFTIAGILFAPVLVRMMAPGFMADPAKLLLTIQLTKLMFPYLVFIGLTAYAMAILYTFRSFFVPAFSPCLLNIAMIVSAYVASKTMSEPTIGLAIGVLVGGVLQLAVHMKPLFNIGMRFKWPTKLHHEGMIKIGRLLIPRIVGSGVYQLSVLIDTFCASLSHIVGAGGISAIYYANRIVQFPMGIFSVALASAVLPSLSDFAHKKDLASIKKVIVFSLENIFFVMCPTTVIIFLLSHPIIRVLFERGEFDSYSTMITSSTLMFYILGLFSFGGIKILVTAFYALQDTKTPVKVAAFCLALNTLLNFILMYPLKVSGIALASAIAGTVDFLILFAIMQKRLGPFNSGILRYAIKVSAASIMIGVFEYWAWHHLILWNDIVKLFLISLFGFMFYGVICYFMKIEQALKVWTWLRQGLKY